MLVSTDALDRLFDEIASLRTAVEQRAATPAPQADTIMGIDPHALYSAASVGERWDLSPSKVASKIEPVRMEGCQNRFRGLDILRFEGVNDKLLAPFSPRLPENVKSLPKRTSQRATGTAGSKKPYRQDLPSL